MIFRVALIVDESNWTASNPAQVIDVSAKSLTAALAKVMGQAELVMSEEDYLSILNDME